MKDEEKIVQSSADLESAILSRVGIQGHERD
jgi:hypothetical protein